MSLTTVNTLSPNSTENLTVLQKGGQEVGEGNKVQYIIYIFLLFGLGATIYTNSWILFLVMGVPATVLFIVLRTLAPTLSIYAASFSLGALCSQLTFQWSHQPHFTITFIVALAGLLFVNNSRILLLFGLMFIAHEIAFYFLIVNKSYSPENTSVFITYGVLTFLQLGFSTILLSRLQRISYIKNSLESKFSLQSSQLEQNINLAKQIASGNFDSASVITAEDILAQSLKEMSKNLKASAEENKNRNWTMTGIAKIAEIMRISNHNMEDLANQIISYLVKYLHATQGGIFVINDTNQDHKFLELKGCYAYDRKKYLEKTIEIGEGLVGQAVLERNTMYLKVVPQDYFSITSGLGQANPNTLIIVPLKTEDSVVGALEMASFSEFHDYERDFLEKVSQNIASSIIFTKNQDRSNQLLHDSQVLTEQLRAQEEEMRQNMEELQATQEDVHRKNADMEAAQKELTKERYLMEALMKSATDSIYFKDLKSRFIRISSNLASAFKVKDPQEVVGKSDFDFFTEEHARPAYEAEQKIIRTGKPLIDLVEKETWPDGRETYVSTSKMPLPDLNGNIVGTFGISRDITHIKKTEVELQKKDKFFYVILKNSSEIYTIIEGDGKIIYQSPSYFRILELEETDLKGVKIFDLLHPDDVANIEMAIKEIKQEADSIAQVELRYRRGNGNWINMHALLQNHLEDENVNSIIINIREAAH